MTLNIIAEDFRPYLKYTLRGFVIIALPEIGIRIKECTLHEKNGRAWIGFPGRQWTDQQGNKQWSNLVEFLDGADRWAFQDAAVAAIKLRFPNAGLRAPEPASPPAQTGQRQSPPRTVDPRAAAAEINTRYPGDLNDDPGF
jgi:hypothetical protein